MKVHKRQRQRRQADSRDRRKSNEAVVPSLRQYGGERQYKDDGAIIEAMVIGEKRGQKQQGKPGGETRIAGEPSPAPGKCG